MDKITRLENIRKSLSELKENKPKVFEEASTFVAELSKRFPALAMPEKTDKSEYAESVRQLRLMLAYAYTQVGNKIVSTVEDSFKTYSGPFEFLQIKRSPQSTISYLYIAVDNQLQKMERSHEVYILKKQGPRDVEVPKRDSDGNQITMNGEVVKEKRSILNLTIWVNDMKELASLAIWGTKVSENEIAPEHLPYESIQTNHGYKMLLNYNGKNFFPPKDPMLKPIDGFVPDYEGMLKTITEKFQQMQEPFDSPGNIDMQKMYYMIGRVTKDPSGNIIISPNEPTTSIIQLQRTPDSRLLDDGDDVIILGNIGKSRSFKGRDGKEVKPNSDYTIFPSAVICLSDPQNRSTENNRHATADHSMETVDKETLKKELNL